MIEPLVLARDAYDRRDWAVARDYFAAARGQGPLSASDVAALADSAWWMGRTDEALAGYEDAYRLYVRAERKPKAALMAISAMPYGRFS